MTLDNSVSFVKKETNQNSRWYFSSKLAPIFLSGITLYIVDFIGLLLTSQLAWIIRFGPTFLEEQYTIVVIIVMLLWSLIGSKKTMYQVDANWEIYAQCRNVLKAWVYIGLFVFALAYFTKSGAVFSRLWAGYWFLLAAVFGVSVRLIWGLLLSRMVAKGLFRKRVAIVAADKEAFENLLFYIKKKRLNVDVVQIYWVGEAASQNDAKIDELLEQFYSLGVDHIWLASNWKNSPILEKTRLELSVLPCEISVPLMDVSETFGERSIVHSEGLATIIVGRKPFTPTQVFTKRCFDIVFSLTALLVLMPFFMVIGLLIKIDSPGPVFFRQKRHGFANGPFEVFKFRTMYSGPCLEKFKQAVKNDSRVTPLGRFLRRSSIDELPQIINVLKGEMSIVGPRPHPLALSDEFIEKVDDYLARHKMRPGITGWAQINGFRGETDTIEKMRLRVEHDQWYVEHWSLGLDIRIILTTLPALFSKNVY